MEKRIFRIIDANFNRAREAARLAEEYCRFVLNCRALTSRAKELRHGLCSAVESFGIEKLAANRDVETDVGRDLCVDGQMARVEMSDCVIAACKRLSEALRVLAEMAAITDVSLVAVFEGFRFDSYALEKDILRLANVVEKLDFVRLYVIVGADNKKSDSDVCGIVPQCAAGGADCIQLRAKDMDDSRFLKLAVRFVDVCRQNKVLAVINDRVDMAVLSGADGVHLGQTDISIEQAKKLCNRPMIFGLSTHSMAELDCAVANGADYVSIGPVFASTTKPALEPVGVEYVRAAVEKLASTQVRHVAIGGINIENAVDVLAAGAKAIAVSAAVVTSDEPERMCRRFRELIHSQVK